MGIDAIVRMGWSPQLQRVENNNYDILVGVPQGVNPAKKRTISKKASMEEGRENTGWRAYPGTSDVPSVLIRRMKKKKLPNGSASYLPGPKRGLARSVGVRQWTRIGEPSAGGEGRGRVMEEGAALTCQSPKAWMYREVNSMNTAGEGAGPINRQEPWNVIDVYIVTRASYKHDAKQVEKMH